MSDQPTHDPSALDFTDRTRSFAVVDGVSFDVIVIGAGITGAGVARDAATRGLSVLLVEAGDIACGTSSRSSKMIHGGLRYLAQGDINLVREAASERQVLRLIAPHLAKKIPFVLPGSWRYVTALRAGLTTFEKLGRVPDHEQHEVWNGRELEAAEPFIGKDRFAHAVVYPEFLTNDARLTLANVRSAAAAGAAVLTYAPVSRLVVEHGVAVGVEVRGALPGESLGATARGTVIVNAAGPWVDAIRAMEDPTAPARLTMTKGVHVVVPRDRLPISRTVVGKGRDKRSVFAVPLHDVTYLGTTDTFYDGADVWPSVDIDDVDYLTEFAREMFDGPRLDHGDIVSMWAGVRPLIGQAGKSPSEISRKDEIWDGRGGVVSIAGGKLTAYRTMAERVVDLAVERVGRAAGPCVTAEQSLVGGEVDVAAMTARLAVSTGDAERLVDLYGSEAPEIVDGVEAEVRHAIRAEGALTLTDVWVRRTARAWFTLEPVGPTLERAAVVMGELLGWSPSERSRQVAECAGHHTDTFAALSIVSTTSEEPRP
jgi:glycerol-3-phosphate dehydrogenase